MPSLTENEIATIIVDCAFRIHRDLGPGLLESVYEEILFSVASEREELLIEKQKAIPVFYDNKKIDLGFRADLIVNSKVIVEIKSVDALHDVHYKQLLTYLKITNLKLGLLINFNEALIKNGLHRVVNNL